MKSDSVSRNKLSRWVSRIAGIALPIGLTVFCYWTVRNSNAANATSLGLIEVIPPLYYVAPFILALSFFIRLQRREPDQIVLGTHIVALIFMLHGVVTFIEQIPRFPVSYTIEGLSEVIQRTGNSVTSLDARMSWPGFFTATGIMAQTAGVPSIRPFLLWAPLVTNLIYAPAVFAIASALSANRSVRWMATWMFFSFCWIGQDYLSPQGTNFMLYMVILALVATYLKSDRKKYLLPIEFIFDKLKPVLDFIVRNKDRKPGTPETHNTTSRQTVAIVLTLFILTTTSILSHQLSPVFLTIVLFALWFSTRASIAAMPFYAVFVFLIFLSWGAINYWSGHMDQLFGGVGKVGNVAADNVTSKVAGDPKHVVVIYARLLFAASVWGLAFIGMFRRLKAGWTDVFALIGLLSPFVVLGAQSYGGEAILRVFLFTLPFASILCAFALYPNGETKIGRKMFVIVCIVSLVLVPLFVLSRFGNEQFEYVTKEENEAIEKMYTLIAPGSTILAIDGNSSWQMKHMEQHSYVYAFPTDINNDISPESLYSQFAQYMDADPYFLLTRSMARGVASSTGRPLGWNDNYAEELVASGKFTLVMKEKDAVLLKPVGSTADLARVP